MRDHIKKLGRRGIDDEFDDSLELSEPDEADAIGLRHDLLLAMRELTGDQREVLELRFLLDKSVAETAIVMNRSEDAVKNLQRRALAAMQRVLAGEAYPTGGRAMTPDRVDSLLDAALQDWHHPCGGIA